MENPPSIYATFQDLLRVSIFLVVNSQEKTWVSSVDPTQSSLQIVFLIYKKLINVTA